jgi:hypothetical protein
MYTPGDTGRDQGLAEPIFVVAGTIPRVDMHGTGDIGDNFPNNIIIQTTTPF